MLTQIHPNSFRRHHKSTAERNSEKMKCLNKLLIYYFCVIRATEFKQSENSTTPTQHRIFWATWCHCTNRPSCANKTVAITNRFGLHLPSMSETFNIFNCGSFPPVSVLFQFLIEPMPNRKLEKPPMPRNENSDTINMLSTSEWKHIVNSLIIISRLEHASR